MLNEDIPRLHRFVTSADASYARLLQRRTHTHDPSPAPTRVPSPPPPVSPASRDVPDTRRDDAIQALMQLGYDKSSARKAVEKSIARGAHTVEDIIKGALR